jgi:hypothetical protein
MDKEYLDFNYIEYISENFIGLSLFVFVFVIIYFIDYITRLNALIYSTPSLIPGLPTPVLNIEKKIKRKVKKQ